MKEILILIEMIEILILIEMIEIQVLIEMIEIQVLIEMINTNKIISKIEITIMIWMTTINFQLKENLMICQIAIMINQNKDNFKFAFKTYLSLLQKIKYKEL